MKSREAARLFARYEPDVQGAKPMLWCRPSEPADVDAIADLSSQREGSELEAARTALLDGWIPPRIGRALFVAGFASGRRDVLAFGRVARFETPAEAPSNCAPPGVYLAGVVVEPGARRSGLARALTGARIEWSGGCELFYFCNARNLASVDLHREFGFVESTRDFWFPGVSFVGGEGILFRRPGS